MIHHKVLSQYFLQHVSPFGNSERSASEYRFSDGTGFMGVHNVQKFSLEPTPAAASGKKFRFKKRKHKWEEDEEEPKQA